MLKFFLIIIAIIFFFGLAIVAFVLNRFKRVFKNMAQPKADMFTSQFQNQHQTQGKTFKDEEVLYSNDKVTVLKGEAKDKKNVIR